MEINKIQVATPEPRDVFNRPPPGWSFTNSMKQWPWEQPPQFTDVDEVVDMILDRIEVPETKERLLSLLLAGVSVEEVVGAIALGGFTEGKFNPDVAELIKAPVAIYLMKLADDYAIPFRLFADEETYREEQEGLPMVTILSLMKDRNPELHDFLLNYDPVGDVDVKDISAGFLNEELTGGEA
jgi:hypothetical protein